MALFEDLGPGGGEFVWDWKRCHDLLDELEVPSADNLMDRLRAIAKRWLESARAVGHPPGCQDKQCTAARKILNFR